MVDRVLLGQGTTARGTSNYGLWVSKPTYNVATCDAEDLLFDSTKTYGQVMAQGTLANTSGAVSHTAVTRSGIKPQVLWKPQLSGTVYSRANAGGFVGNPLFSATGEKAVNISITVVSESANVTLEPASGIQTSIVYYTLRPE